MTSTRTALVTGAASGIGRESARLLAEAGIRVILLDRSEQVREAAAELAAAGAQAEAVVADLSDLAALDRVGDQVLALCDGVDILVNNAGVHPKVDGRIAQFEAIALADWEFVFRVNTTAPFLLCRRCCRR